MLESLYEIIQIRDEKTLMAEFKAFEDSLNDRVKILRQNLARQVIGSDCPDLYSHMSLVESYRDRVGRFLALAETFLEHAQSWHFRLAQVTEGDQVRRPTEHDRRMYQKTLSAGFSGIWKDMDSLIESIDSRVNLCKKLLGIESESGMGSHRPR